MNGYKLREYRQKAGKTQMQVANELNTTQHQYSKYETGKQEPTAQVIIELCKILNTNPTDILGFESV